MSTAYRNYRGVDSREKWPLGLKQKERDALGIGGGVGRHDLATNEPLIRDYLQISRLDFPDTDLLLIENRSLGDRLNTELRLQLVGYDVAQAMGAFYSVLPQELVGARLRWPHDGWSRRLNDNSLFFTEDEAAHCLAERTFLAARGEGDDLETDLELHVLGIYRAL